MTHSSVSLNLSDKDIVLVEHVDNEQINENEKKFSKQAHKAQSTLVWLFTQPASERQDDDDDSAAPYGGANTSLRWAGLISIQNLILFFNSFVSVTAISDDKKHTPGNGAAGPQQRLGRSQGDRG